MGNDEKGNNEPEIDLKAMLESLGDDHRKSVWTVSCKYLLMIYTGDTEKIAELLTLDSHLKRHYAKRTVSKGWVVTLSAFKTNYREAAGNVEQALKERSSGSVTELLC